MNRRRSTFPANRTRSSFHARPAFQDGRGSTGTCGTETLRGVQSSTESSAVVNVMHSFVSSLFLALVVPSITDVNIPGRVPVRDEKFYHKPIALTNSQIVRLSDLSNVTHMDEVLDNICVVRIVGTPQHTGVKNYIKKSMRDLNWTVETDPFEDYTPIFGKLKFENIIAKLNPNAKRYLTLACHYDSKYTRERNFIGATDSAVPCAQMINLAAVMKDQLKSIKNRDLSLMLVFFDGEEAFKEWGPNDSIYGAKHLASIWHNNYTAFGQEDGASELERMDMLVLLDLIGAPDPTFYNYFTDTEKWYSILMSAEHKLAGLEKFDSYSYGHPAQRYFQPYSMEAHIEDDHIPFLRKSKYSHISAVIRTLVSLISFVKLFITEVPILHLIPYPFPRVWHKTSDNRRNIDLKTTENINKILRIFVASYLHVDV